MTDSLPMSAVDRGLASVAALQQAHVTPVDSVLVESPLPSGVAEIVRFLLNAVPTWVQIGGVILAAAAAAYVFFRLVKHRAAIRAWLTSRALPVRWALAVAALALIIAGGVAGAATWDYTQHSNDFCTGCHVMNPAFQRFSNEQNKHGELSCHACHQQSVSASMRQLYLWVAERPEKIKAHSKVANTVCENCHVTGDTATWQRIAATAGHRVHLESDSAPLKNLQCVTCHGVEVHRFRPADETCGQSDCHKKADTDVVLGKMASQTVRHCTSCHAFTADVPALATRDSARGTLVPGRPECLGCHEMQQVLADFNERLEPHGAKCGTCHKPHTQKSPAAAGESCAAAGCHDNWRDNPFHIGASHRGVGEKCLTCHSPHSAKVDASGCEACHVRVRTRGRLRPPIPFDTAQALRRMETKTAPRPPEQTSWESMHATTSPTDEADAAPEPGDGFGLESGVEYPWALDSEIGRSQPPPTKADSFPHARHTKVACLECHRTGEGHGRLTFERPRGCAICHHQDPSPAKCESCHKREKYGAAKQATVTVTVPGRQPNPRPVAFLHERHAARSCVECHTTPVTLAPAPAKATCMDCHTDHHAPRRNCSACHALADPTVEHQPIEVAHQMCDACHTLRIIAELTPTRSLCSTCHPAKATGHYDGKECSVCHFLAAPDTYRSRLTSPRKR